MAQAVGDRGQRQQGWPKSNLGCQENIEKEDRAWTHRSGGEARFPGKKVEDFILKERLVCKRRVKSPGNNFVLKEILSLGGEVGRPGDEVSNG